MVNLKPALVLIFVALIGLILAAVAVPHVHAETIIPGNHTVSGTEVWTAAESPYIVQGTLAVAGTGHLTLEPGTEVRIMADRHFVVQADGQLTAIGTAQQPVTITAISGSFVGLRFHPGAVASLANCDVSHGGALGWPTVDIQSSHVSLDRCHVHDNAGSSATVVQLVGTGLSPTLTNSTIENNTGTAIYQSTIDMEPTYANLTLSGNGVDGVVWNTGTLNRPLTLDGPQFNGSPFISLDSINVNSGAALTLTAGTELKMQADSGLYVKSGGVLAATGTGAAPVTITARDPQAPFLSLAFLPGSEASLAYCSVHHAGASAYSAVDIQSSEVRLHHCTIHDNGVGSGAAVRLTGTSLSPTIENTAIEDNSGYAIYQSTIDMTPVYEGLSFSGNEINAVALGTGYLNRALTLDGQQIGGKPFLSLDSINVKEGGHLILNPGTELRLQMNRGLWVQAGGALTGEGTEQDPVVLKAMDAGSAFVKICFLPGSSGTLAYCDISQAGASNSPAVEIQSSEVTVDHCSIHDNVAGGGAALTLSGAGLSPTISHTTVRDNSGRAVQQSTIDMTPTYVNLTLSGNGTDAVVMANGDLRHTVTLDGQLLNGRPFISLDDINLWDSASLTLAPGTELRMAASHALYVESGGTLVAEGTAAQPVIFTSVEPEAQFYKLHFLPGSTSRLAYCDISRAGRSGFDALAVYEPDTAISHCVIHDNLAWGMRLYHGSGSPRLENLVFMDNGGGGLLVESGVHATLAHTTFARNADAGARIRDGGTATFANTIVAQNGTGVRVDAGGTVTMTHTLWDGNAQQVDGLVSETAHFEGTAAFAADGYHLTAGSAALQVGTPSWVLDDIDGETRPLPLGTAPDLGADESVAGLQSWHKWIDGHPWETGLELSVETSDLVGAVDVIAAESGTPFTLSETWNPLHLSLAEYSVEPPGAGQVITGSGSLSWAVTMAHPEIVTFTKLFHVEPCTWTATTLNETMEGLDIPDLSRTVSLLKTAPDLWLAASGGRQAHAGEIVTFTLTYGNDGGYETGVIVHADLSPNAPLFDADPLPTWQAGDGTAADWLIGNLDGSARGQIQIAVAIASNVEPPVAVEARGSLYDHTGHAADGVTVTVTVEQPPLHDIAVVGAAPGGEVPVGRLAAVTGELFNEGTETEAGVPLRCTIKGPAGGAVYSETVSSDMILPGAWIRIDFPAWVPANEGAYMLACRSMMPGDENPANDLYTHVLTVTLEGAPDVWTKDSDEDTGDVPSGPPWWVSPDVWVRNQLDGGLVHQNPIAFEENTVYVRLRNRGSRTASGTVGVYWDRSRIGWPCRLWSPTVGTISFEDLAPGEVRIVHLSWVPQEPGHHGLHTVIDAEGDPPDISAPCSPHRPRWDNNISWRNVIVHFRPPKVVQSLLQAQGADVDLVNPYDWPKEVDLVVDRVSLPAEGTIVIRLDDQLFDRWWVHEGRWSVGVEVVTATREITVTGSVSATVGGIPLDAHEAASASLAFDAPETGEFEVELQERIDGLTVGGLAYQWIVEDHVAPAVESHRPDAGAVEVALLEPIVVTFTEEIGPLTFNLVLTPALELGRVWWNQPGTVFTVPHAAFAAGTSYSASLTAGDAFANLLEASCTWSFRAREGWEVYLPLVLRTG